MAFCTNCGIEVEEGKLLCDNCMSTPPTNPYDVPVKKEKLPADNRDMRMAALIILPCLLFVNCLFWGGVGAGITLCSLAVLAVTLWYIGKKQARFTAYTVACSVLFALHSLSLTLSDDAFTKGLTLLFLAVLYSVILTDALGLRRYKAGSYRAVADIVRTAVVGSFSHIGDGCFALFRKSDGEGGIARRKMGNVFIGILIALPALLIIVPILISSDAAFEGLLNKISVDSVGELIATLLFGSPVFLLLFSQLFSMGNKEPAPPEQKQRRGVDGIVICSFLAVISAVYVFYLVSQFAYFTGGFAGILPEEYTSAQYARRGFFEMCTICAINLAIIFLSSVICDKTDGALPAGVKALNIFLGLFSLVIIGTAISKMVLYISSFGMTRLRILTSMFMLFLAATFVTVILRLFITKIPYMKVILICACTVLFITCTADVDRVIATYNVNAYISGQLETVDMVTLKELESDAVIDPLMKLCDEAKEMAFHNEAREMLNHRMREFIVIEDENRKAICKSVDYNIRSFNVADYTAKRKLAENWFKYYGRYYYFEQ